MQYLIIVFVLLFFAILFILFFGKISLIFRGNINSNSPPNYLIYGFFINKYFIKYVIDIKQNCFCVYFANKIKLYPFKIKKNIKNKTFSINKEDDSNNNFYNDNKKLNIETNSLSGNNKLPNYSDENTSKDSQSNPKSTKNQEMIFSFEILKKHFLSFCQKIYYAKNIYILLKDTKLISHILLWIIRLFKNICKVILINKLYIKLRLSLIEPSYTGFLYGCCEGIKNILKNKNSRKEIIFEPSFSNEPFFAETEIHFSSSIGKILFPFLIGLLTFPYLNIIAFYLKFKKNQKQK
jgi:hypothetical protein